MKGLGHAPSRTPSLLLSFGLPLPAVYAEHLHRANNKVFVHSSPTAVCLSLPYPQAALNAGHRFFLSTNQVLLVEGPLQTQFIKRVNWEELPEAWGAGSKKRGASGEAGV